MARKVDEYLEYVYNHRNDVELLDIPLTVRDNFKARCKISGDIFYP